MGEKGHISVQLAIQGGQLGLKPVYFIYFLTRIHGIDFPLLIFIAY